MSREYLNNYLPRWQYNPLTSKKSFEAIQSPHQQKKVFLKYILVASHIAILIFLKTYILLVYILAY